MSNELIETILILGTIFILCGLSWLNDYIIKNGKSSSSSFWHKDADKLTPFQKAKRSSSIEFLDRVVNQRKATLYRLFESHFINWEEYNTLYEGLIKWKESKLKDIDDEALLSL